MKVKFQIGSFILDAESTGDDISYADIESAVEVMCVALGIDYDGFVEYIAEDVIIESISEAAEEREAAERYLIGDRGEIIQARR